jgi:hypothetical protein
MNPPKMDKYISRKMNTFKSIALKSDKKGSLNEKPFLSSMKSTNLEKNESVIIKIINTAIKE